MGVAPKIPHGEPLIVATSDERLVRLVETAAGPEHGVVRVDSAEAARRIVADRLAMSHPYEPLVLDAALCDQQTIDAATRTKRTILAVERETDSAVARFARHPELRHVLVKTEHPCAGQVQAMLRKIRGEAPWGMAAYIDLDAPETPWSREVVSDYGRKQEYIELVRGFAAGLGGFRELPEMAATITSELLMNGLFNAPHDRATQRPKYADVARTEPLKVGPGEEIELTYGSDGRLFVVTATDHFGMLSRGILVDNLTRSATAGGSQVKLGSAGAGVGLYILWNASSQLDVRVAPGRRTEVSVVICLSRRYRDFEERGHSLNYFFEEE